MMIRLSMLLLFALTTFVAARPRVVVERDSTLMNRVDPNMQPYFIPGTDSSGPRMVIDPGAMIYQMKVDSINKAAEDKIREQIVALEHNFEDPEFEEKTGRVIGTIVMEQQLALLDIQIDRAVSLRDTLLLMGMQVGLAELLKAHPELEYELMNLDKRISDSFQMLYEHSTKE